ncbi:MAG: hypothetical protein PHQ75_13545, partial [Thermoguttaceae bacterium]|nr:hypothetical protein [Thermoguttaceae bacterium]
MSRCIALYSVLYFISFLTLLSNTTTVFAAGSDSVLVLENGQKRTIQGTIESMTGLYGVTISSAGQTLHVPMT